MISGIYIIRNIANNKIYLGSAVNLKRRFTEHKTRLRAGNHHNEILQRAWNKYGEEKFQFEIFEYLEKECLLQKETILISVFDCLNRNKGYNICSIGRNHLGVKRSSQTVVKISNSLKGRKISEETKERIRASLKGQKFTEDRIDAQRKRPVSKKMKLQLAEMTKRRWQHKHDLEDKLLTSVLEIKV